MISRIHRFLSVTKDRFVQRYLNNRDTCESRPHVNQPGNQTFEELNESLQTSGILCKLTEANKITIQPAKSD